MSDHRIETGVDGRAATQPGSQGSAPQPPAASSPVGADPSRVIGCDFCRDPEDETSRCLPMYGVAPHECYWRKGPEYQIGQSTLLPIEQWTEAFVPDLEAHETWADFRYPQACGVFYCPKCDADKYAAAWARLIARIGDPPRTSDSDRSGKADKAGTGLAVGESADPKGIANTLSTPSNGEPA